MGLSALGGTTAVLRHAQRTAAHGTRWLTVHLLCRYFYRYVIVANGNGREYVPAEPPGLALVESYATVPWDAESFEGQTVLVIGKGNAAFEVAGLTLGSASIVQLISPNPLKLAWNTRHPGHARANNFHLLDAYQLKLLSGILDAKLIKVEACADNTELCHGRGGFAVTIQYAHADGEVEVLRYDRVIRATGFGHSTKLYHPDGSATPKMADFTGDRYPLLTPAFEAVNVAGLFFAGTIAQARDFRRAGSAFVDGFRYNVRTLVRLLSERMQPLGRGAAYPRDAVPLVPTGEQSAPEHISEAFMARINRNSGLWTQFRFLADVLITDAAGCPSGVAAGDYMQELPKDYILDVFAGHCGQIFVLDFEWGDFGDEDVMKIKRHPEAGRTDYKFLHPIIREYTSGTFPPKPVSATGPTAQGSISEHHVVGTKFLQRAFGGLQRVWNFF